MLASRVVLRTHGIRGGIGGGGTQLTEVMQTFIPDRAVATVPAAAALFCPRCGALCLSAWRLFSDSWGLTRMQCLDGAMIRPSIPPRTPY